MRDPTTLSHGELAHIVAKLQDALFLECFHDVGQVYNLDKEVDGADLIEDMCCVLHEFGLVPRSSSERKDDPRPVTP